MLEAGAIVSDRLEAFYRDREPTTIIHGDFRLDNLMFHPDGTVTVLDWQTCTVGPAPRMPPTSWEPGSRPSCAGPTRLSCSSTTTGVSSTPAWSSTETTAGAPTAGAPGPGWSWRWGVDARRAHRAQDDMFMAMASRHALQALDLDAGELLDDRRYRVRPPVASSGPRRPFHHEDPVAGHSVEHLGCSGCRARAPRPVRSTSSDPDRCAPPVAAGLVGPTAGDPARHRSSICRGDRDAGTDGPTVPRRRLIVERTTPTQCRVGVSLRYSRGVPKLAISRSRSPSRSMSKGTRARPSPVSSRPTSAAAGTNVARPGPRTRGDHRQGFRTTDRIGRPPMP